ncbi:hypothetical protein G6F65_020955 [Rhizopus arrhizus]|nr:hypothetical protein G6F65_020955 [Rhizopus arrhizus]
MSVSSNDLETARDAAKQHQCNRRQAQAHDAQAGRKRKIHGREPQLVDQCGNRRNAAPADHLWRGEGAERPGERGGDAGQDARHRQGKRDGQESADRPGAQAFGGFLVIAVDVRDGGSQHQHDHRNGDVHQRHQYAKMAEHQRQRRVDQSQLEQHRIDEARAAQHDDPGIDLM